MIFAIEFCYLHILIIGIIKQNKINYKRINFNFLFIKKMNGTLTIFNSNSNIRLVSSITVILSFMSALA